MNAPSQVGFSGGGGGLASSGFECGHSGGDIISRYPISYMYLTPLWRADDVARGTAVRIPHAYLGMLGRYYRTQSRLVSLQASGALFAECNKVVT